MKQRLFAAFLLEGCVMSYRHPKHKRVNGKEADRNFLGWLLFSSVVLGDGWWFCG